MTWLEYFGGLLMMFGTLGILGTGIVIWYELFVREQ